MIRSIKISLKEATQQKQNKLIALRREIKSYTQSYINSLWVSPGKLDTLTKNRISGGSLSERHRTTCLKVALETISATKKVEKATGVRASRPKILGAIRLSSLVCKIEKGKGSFDFVLKISGLKKGTPIVIPFKSHKRLNYWLAKPGAKLLQGCTLGDNWAALWIELPNHEAKDGKTLAVDIGINKLLVDSSDYRYGTRIKQVCARVRRCKPGSKGRLKASRSRKDYINSAVKQLPWGNLGVLGVEDLTNLKKGKKPRRGKKFRKAIAPWTYRQAITRIEQLAQENRVLLVAVNPRNTSRTCPRCGLVAKENRIGENFQCVGCNYSADADFVGAQNILARTIGTSGQSMVAQC